LLIAGESRADVHEFAGGRIAMTFPLRHGKLKYCTRSNNQSH
jgi:hypothetical protein